MALLIVPGTRSEAFNSTSRYLDDLLYIDNPYFLPLIKTNPSDTEPPFLDLDLSITHGIVSTKTFDKRDDFNLK